jgi:hypothetical protein
VILLVGGDDFINPAGEVPGADASLRDVTEYVARADTTSFWLGRSIGLLGLCALLIFVASVARHITATPGVSGALPSAALGAGWLAVTLQFMAAPPVFAAVHGGSDLDPEVTRALLDLNMSFSLSFIPLGLFLGCVAVAGLRHRAVPRWLAAVAGVLAIGLVGGLVGRPQEPAVFAYVAFFLTLPWFVVAGIVLMLTPSPEPSEA